MKKIILTVCTGLIGSFAIGQLVQGSIKPVYAQIFDIPGTTPTAHDTLFNVAITIKPSTTVTTRVSGVTLCVAIPISAAGPNRPAFSIDNTDNTSITYSQQDGETQAINGVDHYTYNIIGTGSVTATADDKTYTAGVDNPLLKIVFIGDKKLRSQIKLANFPDGGPTANSFFALSFLGADVANEPAQFYAIPSVSTAINDGNGYAGTSFAQTTELVPLPVRFLSFSVAKNNNAALLNWTIDNESSVTSKYEVERSTNGIDFSKIATVNARNNGRPSNTYDLTDADLTSVRSSGTVYYRIKQLDLDGRFVYSDIKNVRLGGGKGLAITAYPNPVKDFTKLTFDLAADTDVMIAISDAAGKQIQNIQMQGIRGINVKQVNFSKFAAGSYNLKVTAGSEIKTMSIVKVN